MTKLLSVFLILTGVFSWAYPRFDFSPEPCVEPITYSVGSFDRRFGLSQADFLAALSEAEEVWEASSGKNLFDYSPEGELTVNLIYDYRQRATNALYSIEDTLEKGNAHYRDLEALYRKVKAQHDASERAYNAQLALWEEHNAAYRRQVEEWNSGPRTSEDEFRALEASRAALESEAAALKASEERLNLLAKDVNVLVPQLNELAKELNLGILQYNEVGGGRGETFTGGRYESDADGERIDIFEFESRIELVRLLAHELGHALGLEHVNDPDAIMYYLEEGSSPVATEADLAALNRLCGVE